jgi:hypothetical protein
MNNNLKKKHTNPHQCRHGMHLLTDENDRDVIICREPFECIGNFFLLSTCSEFAIAVINWLVGRRVCADGVAGPNGSKPDWTTK